MPWKCPKCGTENTDDRHVCMACGYVRPSRVILTAAASGKAMAVGVDTAVGKSLLRSMDDPDFIYASDPQFHILRDPGSAEWVVVHDGGAKNPTHFNGKLLSTKTPLCEGAYLSVGPTKLRLKVTIQPG